jgi:hypothetical protein
MSPCHKRRTLLGLLFVGLPLLLAPAPAERTLTQKLGPATAVLRGERAGAEGLEVRLSGEVQLTLEVVGPAPLEVEPPAKITASAAWSAAPASPVTTRLPDGRVRWRQTVELEPLQKGKLPLPLEPLRYRAGGGGWQEVAWKPFAVVVTTEIPKADIGEARDITTIEELPPESPWSIWLAAALAAAAVLSLLVTIWVMRRRLPQALPLAPDKAALRELERLAGLSLATARDVERYHTLLSDVVRRYLERRCELPASRQTTAEFLKALQRSPHLPADQQSLLRDFLEGCDLGKFAPVTPGPEQCRLAADLARRLIEQAAAVQPAHLAPSAQND